MQKFDVQIALEGIAEAKTKWSAAFTEFNASVETVMARLIREAAKNYMSAEEVAKHSGLTVKRVRLLMRSAGLDPKQGKRLLSKNAAEALAENAALLGIEPHEMDLMSPLAYLPMGAEMRKALEAKPTAPTPEFDTLVKAFQAAWHEADERGESGHRTEAGIAAVLALVSGNEAQA